MPARRRALPSRRLRAPRLLAAVLAAAMLATGRAQEEGEPPPAPPDAGAPGAESGSERAAEVQRALTAAWTALQAAQPALQRAFDLLGRHEWTEAVAPFREAAATLAPHALLGGLHDQCLYNTACALTRTGHPDEAVAALRDALAHGLRDILTPGPGGRPSVSRGLTFPHLLMDPDLDPLRDREDFRALLAPLLRAEEPVVEATEAASGAAGRLPGVVVLLRTDGDVGGQAAAWRAALADVPAVVAFVEGPVRPQPQFRRWLLDDGDERFGVEKAAAALDALRADARVDPGRVRIAAAGPLASEAAWAVALARPGDIAGVVLGPARFHAAWHADALAGLAAARAGRPAFDVRLVGPAERAAELLRAAGAEVAATAFEPPTAPGQPPLAVFELLRRTVAGELARALR